MNTTAKRHRTVNEQRSGAAGQTMPSLLARATLRGSAAAVVSGAVLSLTATAIAYMNADPDALITPLALAALTVSCVVDGFVSWRSCRAAPLLCGALSGLSLLLISFFFSCFLSDGLRSSMSAGLSWGLRGGILLFCILGSLMAANMPKGKRAKHKKRR